VKKQIQLLDAVTAYDAIASRFNRLSEARRSFLETIENCIIHEISKTAYSMLDVGSGDGRRANRIAASCGVQRLVLLEPSAAMRALTVSKAETWGMRAEELGTVKDQFDVITCLWNVLGHIDSSAARAEVLGHMSRLLRKDGLLFIDFNHRYNAAEYGMMRTILRVLRDAVNPCERNGDVTVRWPIDNEVWATKGHVFIDREVRRLMAGAGLKIQRKTVIHYSTGEIRQRAFEGNLFYVASKADMASRRF
jgi:ubiquinone/menaquinone biosynthesis C-methylase UbiE